MMHAISYIRVSGKSQIDGDGPERQLAAIHAFCKTRGFDVAAGWQDLGVSGVTDSFDRPGLAAALADAAQRGAIIVVERADRIARDLIVSEIFFRECRTRGVGVYSADTGQELVFTDEDPSRKLIRQILGALAEWEKSVIVKKLAAGRARVKLETGRCEGRKPYAGPALAIIREQYRRGMSSGAIAGILNWEKIESPAGKNWTRRTVSRIIERIEQKP